MHINVERKASRRCMVVLTFWRGTPMEIDLTTFLTGLYCIVDDVYRARFAAGKRGRPGPKGKLADSEVLTLAMLFQWLSHGSERRFLSYATHHWHAYFPRLLRQS